MSAWGSSWGAAWASSWGQITVQSAAPSAGNIDWLKKKKKSRIVRASDLEERDRIEAAAERLARASMPMVDIPMEGVIDDELEDEEILLIAITTIH